MCKMSHLHNIGFNLQFPHQSDDGSIAAVPDIVNNR